MLEGARLLVAEGYQSHTEGSSSGFGEGAAEQEGVEPAGQPHANRVPALPVGEAGTVRGGIEAAPGWAVGAAGSNEMLNEVTADTGPWMWEKVINNPHLQFYFLATA